MATGENEAATKIGEAENILNSAYEAVLETEKAGANITGLLGNLTEATELLSKAKSVLSTNESAAIEFANQSQAKLDGFLAKADAFKADATQQRYWDFMVNVVGSIAGTVVVICGSFVVWAVLKRKYEKTGSGV